MTRHPKYPHVYEVTHNGVRKYKAQIWSNRIQYNCGYFPLSTSGANDAYEAARTKYEQVQNKRLIAQLCNSLAAGKVMLEDLIKLTGTINRLQHGKYDRNKLITEIENEVCGWFKVDPKEIHSTSRKQRLNEPRGMCMYFMYKYGHTLKSIGQYFDKDHTTVIHHYYTIAERAMVDDVTKNIINRIEMKLNDTNRTIYHRPETNIIPARDITLFAGSHQEQPRNAIMV